MIILEHRIWGNLNLYLGYDHPKWLSNTLLFPLRWTLWFFVCLFDTVGHVCAVAASVSSYMYLSWYVWMMLLGKKKYSLKLR